MGCVRNKRDDVCKSLAQSLAQGKHHYCRFTVAGRNETDFRSGYSTATCCFRRLGLKQSTRKNMLTNRPAYPGSARCSCRFSYFSFWKAAWVRKCQSRSWQETHFNPDVSNEETLIREDLEEGWGYCLKRWQSYAWPFSEKSFSSRICYLVSLAWPASDDLLLSPANTGTHRAWSFWRSFSLSAIPHNYSCLEAGAQEVDASPAADPCCW